MSASSAGMMFSASPSTKCGISGNRSWPEVTSGPPAITVFPNALQRAATSRTERSCTSIADTST